MSATRNKECYSNQRIINPSKNDVLLGRGSGVNNHSGNEYFRNIVKKFQSEYIAAPDNYKKYLITMKIMESIRNLKPEGRFLLKDPKTKLWNDVGDEKTRRKISQALRENIPEMRNCSHCGKRKNDSDAEMFNDLDQISNSYFRKKNEVKYDEKVKTDNERYFFAQKSAKSISLDDYLIKSNITSNLMESPQEYLPMELSLSEHEMLQTSVGTFNVNDMSMSFGNISDLISIE